MRVHTNHLYPSLFAILYLGPSLITAISLLVRFSTCETSKTSLNLNPPISLNWVSSSVTVATERHLKILCERKHRVVMAFNDITTFRRVLGAFFFVLLVFFVPGSLISYSKRPRLGGLSSEPELGGQVKLWQMFQRYLLSFCHVFLANQNARSIIVILYDRNRTHAIDTCIGTVP